MTNPEGKGDKQRLILIGLDGYEARIADSLIADGHLPHISSLMKRSACVDLDHGRNKLTGLSWQHFATAQGPVDSGRWSAVDFNSKAYVASQPLSTEAPFLSDAGDRVVILDAPYFDLRVCPDMKGFVNWGAHDPGVAAYCRPANLYKEIEEKFGPYPAPNDIYAFCWTDAEATAQTAENLRKALEVRNALTCWTLAERIPDWDMAITVVSELHSAIEPLWHGFDEAHPLYQHESAKPARDGLIAIYKELDKMVADIEAQFPDAAICMFWMHGMGTNDADVPSMILLPELLYRHAYGKENFTTPDRWKQSTNSYPPLEPGEFWSQAVMAEMKEFEVTQPPLTERAGDKLKKLSAKLQGRRADTSVTLDWMPSAGYSFAWSGMPAFALPSFYDGRIRINVKGREENGVVEPENYSAAMDEIEQLLKECRDIRTGAPIVREVHRTSPNDPMAVPISNGDMEIIWDGEALGYTHPKLGEIGPVPIRRTGGHTGGHGQFCLVADGVEPGHYGLADAMDVSPTLEEWLGLAANGARTGKSLMSRLSKQELATST